MVHLCVFDVNVTLLDLVGLALQSRLRATITDAYQDFGTSGNAALSMTAVRQGITRRRSSAGHYWVACSALCWPLA